MKGVIIKLRTEELKVKLSRQKLKFDKKRGCLFVGGPMHGRFLQVAPAIASLVVQKEGEPKITYSRYNLTQRSYVNVFVATGINFEILMCDMVEAYEKTIKAEEEGFRGVNLLDIEMFQGADEETKEEGRNWKPSIMGVGK